MYDGNHLVDGEIFVDTPYQKFGIATELLRQHLKLAQLKYDAVTMDALTYRDESGFPFSWYDQLGFRENPEGLIIIKGDVGDVLGNLNRRQHL